VITFFSVCTDVWSDATVLRQHNFTIFENNYFSR